MKKSKIKSIKFYVLNYLSQVIYSLREFHLQRLNEWMDNLTSKYYQE